MVKMTSGERMQAVMMGKKPDRVPVNPFVMGYAAQITGISIGDYYADGDKCFEAQFAAMRLHGYDVTPMYGYASAGPWEFGGEIGFPYKSGHSAPYVIKHPVNSIEDVENLEVPDFDKELPGAYGIADILGKRCYELGMPVTFQSGSTFTAASVVAETSLFLRWVIKEPKILHLLLDKVSDMYVNALEYFAEKYGAEKCMPFDGGPVESNTLLSPKQFKEFAYPPMEKLHMKIKELGFPAVLMHPCADQNLNIPYYIELREKMNWQGRYIWLFGPETPVPDQIKAFGDHDIICGNVDPPSLQTRSYEEVVMMCKENIEQGKDSPSGFILAPGCEFPPGAAPIKLMAMMDAAEKFGRYD
ncbi:MAG: uroporphyrinogen decarboxylase family protein [Candidatus Methanofastidiosia archaeon]